MYLHLDFQSLAIFLVVGLIAGWIASKIVTKHGMGIVGDTVVGVIGALTGDWLMRRVGIHLGTRIASTF